MDPTRRSTSATGTPSLYARDAWDPSYDYGGAFDSGWVPTELQVNAGGGSAGVLWSVSGDTTGTLDYTGQACGVITGVDLVAGAQTTGTAEFGEVTIDFLKNGVVEDSWTGQGPSATSTDPSSPFAEQDLFVRPSVNDATAVTVSGNVRMTTPAGVFPGPADLYTNVFVNTTAGGPTS